VQTAKLTNKMLPYATELRASFHSAVRTRPAFDAVDRLQLFRGF